MENFTKILAINFGGIGDEILFLPTLISLKKEFPNSEITLALETRSKSIKDLTDVIDKIALVDIKNKNKYVELMKFIFKSRFANYDIGVSAGANKFMSIILWLCSVKKRYGYDTGALSRVLLTQAVKLNKNQYAVKMYHDLVKPLTDNVTELPQINVEAGEKIPDSVLIHPGVSQMSVKKGIVKTITPKIWADTIKLLLENGKKVILAGGPDDDKCIKEIFENCPDIEKNTNFENFYGKTKNLKELAVLIGKAEKFLCSDSAPLHIAVALGVETYAIFGPTDDKKLIPPTVKAIKANDCCKLKPCLWEKRQTSCPTLECLKITPEHIVSIVKV